MHSVLLHAKSFVTIPRSYLRAWGNFLGKRNQARRWGDIANFNPDWDERTQLMAQMVAPGSSVLEFGSGREQLEKFLPPGCSYQPSDIVARSPRTLVCDLNRGFPPLDKTYDVILLSGVSEYIYDFEELLHYMRHVGRSVLFSYVATDDIDCIATRMNNGWVLHITDDQMRKCIEAAGFTIAETKRWRQQIIYRLV